MSHHPDINPKGRRKLRVKDSDEVGPQMHRGRIGHEDGEGPEPGTWRIAFPEGDCAWFHDFEIEVVHPLEDLAEEGE